MSAAGGNAAGGEKWGKMMRKREKMGDKRENWGARGGVGAFGAVCGAVGGGLWGGDGAAMGPVGLCGLLWGSVGPMGFCGALWGLWGSIGLCGAYGVP